MNEIKKLYAIDAINHISESNFKIIDIVRDYEYCALKALIETIRLVNMFK